ncbi:hypothetical protein M440DRAFT_314017 [Trichoderma longibrachiatum ATCC 18648]|uniref:Uncharacterized protein n=1 Tax=Trichoderma longibrachiatum ATCC 18648 TaxID=983965 RepID=A0A2T4C3J6_TRILO|nr:hypothetical protein M440DRAFT_314017 [Trichoderma longibrachiatum ATCC 18648]
MNSDLEEMRRRRNADLDSRGGGNGGLYGWAGLKHEVQAFSLPGVYHSLLLFLSISAFVVACDDGKRGG